MSEFLAMDGYASFVWGSYAFGLAVFAWNLWSARALRNSYRRRARIAWEDKR